MTLQYSIANCSIELNVQGEMPQLWNEMYRTYQQKNVAAPDIRISAVPCYTWENDYAVAMDELVVDGKTTLQVKAPWAMGEFKLDGSCLQGSFRICALHEFGWYLTLKLALAFWLEHHAGLLIHASGVWLNDEVWIFSGESNAGKTTIAVDLKNEGETFSEDQVALKYDNHQILWAHATPLGEKLVNNDSQKRGKVAGIVFIEKASIAECHHMDVHNAMVHLYQNTNWCTRQIPAAQRVLSILQQIISQNGCYWLKFAKDTTFWPTLLANKQGR